MDCVSVCQLMQDFVFDCVQLLFAYFSDPSRVARLADPLEEEVLHHAAIIQRCNTSNASLMEAVGSQTSFSTPSSVITIPSVITGRSATFYAVTKDDRRKNSE